MKDRIKEIRNTILSDTWSKHKNKWAMDEIAEAMGINLKTAYRVLKEAREKKTITK